MTSDDNGEKQYHESPSFVEVISRLAHEIRESRKVSAAQFAWFQSQAGDFSEKQNKRLAELRASIESAIFRTEIKIMSVLSEFADRVEVRFGEVGTAVDGLVTGIGGIDKDVQGLKKLIADLQASPGAITPDDQARLDKIEAGLGTLSQKTSVAAQMVKDLDAATADAPIPEPA